MRCPHEIRCAAAAVALFGLAACDREPGAEANVAQSIDAGPSNETGTADALEGDLANSTLPLLPGDQNDGAGLPPASEDPRFVGLWAAEAAFCANRTWQFAPDSLRTPAGSQCSFSKVTAVAGGYDIAARCTAEAPPSDEVIRIRFAESARAMLFESDAIADAGLIYCGPLSDDG